LRSSKATWPRARSLSRAALLPRADRSVSSRNREDKLVAEGFADAAEVLDPAAARPRCAGRLRRGGCATPSPLPFEEGLKRERGAVSASWSPAISQRRSATSSSAEREAARGAGHPGRNEAAEPITSGAVIGAGTNGWRHRDVLRQCRHPGKRLSRPGATSCKGASIGSPPIIVRTVSRGGLGAEEMERRMALISGRHRVRCGRLGRSRDRGGVSRRWNLKKAGFFCRSRSGGKS